MKKFFVILLILKSAIAFSQNPIQYERVYKIDSINKAKLYSIVNEWFASTYNKSTEVIQMTDKEEGIIVGKGAIRYDHSKHTYGCYGGYIKYTISVYIKDGRYKVILSDFIHTVDYANSPACALGQLTNAELYATQGISKKYHNEAWNDMKSKISNHSEYLLNSLNKHVLGNSMLKNDW